MLHRFGRNWFIVRMASAVFLAASMMGQFSLAGIIQFDLVGKAGPGLIGANENGAIAGNPGTGGEIGTGISYDDVANILTLNVGWGSGNGFTNLSGTATATHIHGPTALPLTPADFTLNFGVRHGLDASPSANVTGTWNPSATDGSFIGTVLLDEIQESILVGGHYYFNVHTLANGGGEIRGNLVSAVPEPGSLALLGLASFVGLGITAWRNRKQ